MPAHKKILLVDDDSDDQLFFTDALSEVNPDIECITAKNGLEAIVHLKTISPMPTIIFLDLNMPFMNGFECLAELQKENKFKNIPVVIYSTSSNTIDVERTKEMGAKHFMTKPSDFNILKTKLREILSMEF